MADMEKIFYKTLYLNSCLETSTRDLPWKPDEKNKIISMFLLGHFHAIRTNS